MKTLWNFRHNIQKHGQLFFIWLVKPHLVYTLPHIHYLLSPIFGTVARSLWNVILSTKTAAEQYLQSVNRWNSTLRDPLGDGTLWIRSVWQQRAGGPRPSRVCLGSCHPPGSGAAAPQQAAPPSTAPDARSKTCDRNKTLGAGQT